MSLSRNSGPRSNPARLLWSVLTGVSFGGLTLLQGLARSEYTTTDRMLLLFIPSLCVAYLAYALLSWSSRWDAEELADARAVLALLAVGGAVALLISYGLRSPLPSLLALAPATTCLWLLMKPAAYALQDFIRGGTYPRLVLAWLLASPAAYFTAAFFSNAHPGAGSIVLISLAAVVVWGVFAHYSLGRLREAALRSPSDAALGSLLLLVILSLSVGFMLSSARWPAISQVDLLLLDGDQLGAFAVPWWVSLPWLAAALGSISRFPRGSGILGAGSARLLKQQFPGLVLALCALFLYLQVGLLLNQPRFDVDDVFFDSDAFIWRFRLTTDHWQDFYWRAVHPLALLILRPLVSLIAFVLRGDRELAATFLAASAGAAGVFFIWRLARTALGHGLSAMMVGSIFALSASQLLFGSLIETYGILAACSLLILVLLRDGSRSSTGLVSAGLASAGLTLAHFGQDILAAAAFRPQFKWIARFVLLVLVLLVVLSLVGEVVYPRASPLFFVPSAYGAERRNIRAITLHRLDAMAKTFAFFSVVAPEPMVFLHDLPLAQFRFHKAETSELSEYQSPLQKVTAASWALLLAMALAGAARVAKSAERKLAVAGLLSVAFNVALHLRFGKELFLYSADWTYALLLVLALAWARLLRRPWVQVVFVGFSILLMLNDLQLLSTLMRVSAPFFE